MWLRFFSLVVCFHGVFHVVVAGADTDDGATSSSSHGIHTVMSNDCDTTMPPNSCHNISASSLPLPLEPWQECSAFIAPSQSGGNGVFAARDFFKDEIVELASFFLAVDHRAPAIMNSVLHDYVYGYTRVLEEEEEMGSRSVTTDNGNGNISQQQNGTKSKLTKQMSVVLWGLGGFFNHHPTSPNVVWKVLGGEPHPYHFHTDTLVQVVGFYAKRDIQAGEELFVTYGEDDGGASWFRNRHLTMRTEAAATSAGDGTTGTPSEHRQLPTVEDEEHLTRLKQTYCSKMYAGMDRWLYQHRVRPYQPGDLPYVMPIERLAPPPPKSPFSNQESNNCYNDPEYPWAIAKVPISAGDRIDLAPALVMDRALTDQSPLAPLVYYWNDLTENMQEDVRKLRRQGYYVVQYQSESNQWNREDRFSSLEQSVILPLAGRIGRIQRVGDSHLNDDGTHRANCYMKIHAAAAAGVIHDDKIANGNNDAAKEREQHDEEKTDPFSTGNAGIMLELIATRDIAPGERIRINLPLSGTLHERIMLHQEMQRSGQVYAPLPPQPSMSMPHQQQY